MGMPLSACSGLMNCGRGRTAAARLGFRPHTVRRTRPQRRFPGDIVLPETPEAGFREPPIRPQAFRPYLPSMMFRGLEVSVNNASTVRIGGWCLQTFDEAREQLP